MPRVYYSRYVGERWTDWSGGFELPPFPRTINDDICTVSFARRDGVTWCYVYDPESTRLVWCSWDGYEWTDWEGRERLASPPNDFVQEEECFFSMSTHGDQEWMVAFNPEDGSVFWAPWEEHGFGAWDGDKDLVDDPPNLGEDSDVFIAGDGDREWLISVNIDDMSVFISEYDDEDEEFDDWERISDLPIPEDWIDCVDLDGDATNGTLTVFATVYDEDDDDY